MDYKSDLKRIQALKNKKYRREYEQFFIEGQKIIEEALDSDCKILEIWLKNGIDDKISQKANEKGIETKFVNQSWLERAGNLKSNNFGIAVLEVEKAEVPNENSWILVLEDINDPGNLGTIIRIADWYGIKEIICSPNSVELYNPKVLAASKGSFLRINLNYLDIGDFLKTYEGEIFAAELNGESIYEIDTKASRGVIIMGSESHGISDSLLKHVKTKIHIPGSGKAESLNVAISTAIILDNFNRMGRIKALF